MSFDSFADAVSFLLWSTFIISCVLGLVANKTNFCTMGAVSDLVNMGDTGRFRAWLLAIATAMIGVSVLEYQGILDIDGAFPPYRDSQLLLAEHILGGFLFGVGMTLGSGCGNKTLVRIGGGNLKSFVVFGIIAVIAYYMTSPLPNSDQTLYSLFFYDWMRPLSVSLSGQSDIGAMLSSDNSATVRLAAGLVVALLLLVYSLRSAEFRRSKDKLLGGIVIGLAVLSGWYITSNIDIKTPDNNYTLSSYYDEWDMLAESNEGKPAVGRTLSAQSYTFINPIAQSYGYVKDGFATNLLTFGLVSVFGVAFGSLLWSLMARTFRIEWFHDLRDFITHAIGAVLMGLGGVLALGCTIGQGITGFSTLALGSIVTFITIVFGAALTMKIQYYKLVYEDEASFIKSLLSALVDMKLLPAALRKLDAV